jgi:DNA mismatch endonuclease (patch repair protein)
MSRQKTRDTRIELALRRELFGRGLRYRLQGPVVPGTRRKGDLEFRAARVAVFVDGCFWHACPIHGSVPKSNRAWWKEKLEGNVRRDRDTDERLTASGWTVIRVWEHEPTTAAAERIEATVRAALGEPTSRPCREKHSPPGMAPDAALSERA